MSNAPRNSLQNNWVDNDTEADEFAPSKEPSMIACGDGKTPSQTPTDVRASENSMPPQPKGGLFKFADRDDMKKRVRQNMNRKSYSVAVYYHKEGMFTRLAQDPRFENATLGIIVLNALWMAIDTDWNKASDLLSAEPLFQAAEHFFCVYFSFEWVVRFMAFEKKRSGLLDAWFVFDSLLVLMMVMETWVFTLIQVASGSEGGSPLGNASILRLFRLLRLSRLMRMLRSLPELMILVKGMARAMSSVVYVLALLIAVTYVFGIAFTQLSTGMEFRAKYFSNVALAMYSLLIYGTFLDDLSAFLNDIRAESEVMVILAFAYICLAALTIMNMLIGVLCEVVQAVSDREQEEMAAQRLNTSMQTILKQLDEDDNDMISVTELKGILNHDEALIALNDLDIDATCLVDFADMFFLEDGTYIELTFDRFIELVFDLRGSNTATVKDVMRMGKTMSQKQDLNRTTAEQLVKKTEALEQSMDDTFARLEGQLGHLLTTIRGK